MAEQEGRTEGGGGEEAHVAVRIPATFVEDFRAAVVEEIATDCRYVGNDRKEIAEALERGDEDRAARYRPDLADTMSLLVKDCRLLVQVGPSGDRELEATADASTLAHVFETLARDVVDPRLREQLDGCPLDESQAGKVRELLARLGWAVDRTAEHHALAAAAVQTEEGE